MQGIQLGLIFLVVVAIVGISGSNKKLKATFLIIGLCAVGVGIGATAGWILGSMTAGGTLASVLMLVCGIAGSLIQIQANRNSKPVQPNVRVAGSAGGTPSMSNGIQREIESANGFANQIEDLVVARGQCPTGERNTPLMAYWSLAFEFQRAILCLIDHKFYGAAFALVRPIVEATIRAHVVIMASAEVLKQLEADTYRTNLATVGKEIDAAFGSADLFENFLHGARKALHSYTHVGMLQMGRRFSGTDLKANYSDAEIIEVIRVSTSAVFMVNNVVTKYLGFEEEWKKNTELLAEWGKHD